MLQQKYDTEYEKNKELLQNNENLNKNQNSYMQIAEKLKRENENLQNSLESYKNQVIFHV